MNKALWNVPMNPMKYQDFRSVNHALQKSFARWKIYSIEAGEAADRRKPQQALSASRPAGYHCTGPR
jgi:hypothetical protein